MRQDSKETRSQDRVFLEIDILFKSYYYAKDKLL